VLTASGPTLPVVDSQIAATALTHGLVVATRNAADFQNAGVETKNPFDFSLGSPQA
jgi:predicted nucleic acid-binding protein